MTDMLTAKDVQDLLQVDRSTVYRMAEAGRLPALKVGRQWRFPAAQVRGWLADRGVTDALGAPVGGPFKAGLETDGPANRRARAAGHEASQLPLARRLPLAAVQAMQDAFADALGVMTITTDMDGQPLTEVSNICGLFAVVQEAALPRCIEQWRQMAADPTLVPRFERNHLGLLCTRGLIQSGSDMAGMVVMGGVAPSDWPPTARSLELIAADLGVPRSLLNERLHQVIRLDEGQQNRVLVAAQRLANIISLLLPDNQ